MGTMDGYPPSSPETSPKRCNNRSSAALNPVIFDLDQDHDLGGQQRSEEDTTGASRLLQGYIDHDDDDDAAHDESRQDGPHLGGYGNEHGNRDDNGIEDAARGGELGLAIAHSRDCCDPRKDTITTFIVLLTGVSAISGLLFGYDTASISGALVNIHDDLGGPLQDFDKEAITSITTLGALVGGLVAGGMSDHTGRKPVIGIASILFIAGALWQAWCNSVTTMCIGRFIVGLGVGQASCIVPVYIGELSPSAFRGRLVTINCVLITLGQVIAYVVGMIYQDTAGGWRWMVGLGAMPGILQLVSLAVLPESPRILLLQSRRAEARTITRNIYPLDTEDELEMRLTEIMSDIRSESLEPNAMSTKWLSRARAIFASGPDRRALIIGAGLQAGQQLCGFNTLMYYSASIFASLGYHNATGVGCLIALVNFGFTLLALRLVDSLGRRGTMLYTVPFMVVSLVLCSILFHSLTASTGGVLMDGADYPPITTGLLVLTILLYVSAYATGLGNIPWQQGELFRTHTRGLATSICTATNWSCNFIVSATFLSLMNAATPAGAFVLYAALCMGAWIFSYYLYPETSGLSLEEVYLLFEDGFGVAESIRRRPVKPFTLMSPER